MLWEQLEQCGFLQQLPDAVNLHVLRLTADQYDSSLELPQHTINLANLVLVLGRLYPMQEGGSFLESHAAGQRCVVPVMQLRLSGLQYTTMVVAQAGRQDWMMGFLRCCWDIASDAANAAAGLVSSLADQQATAAGSGRGSSSDKSGSSGGGDGGGGGSSGSGGSGGSSGSRSGGSMGTSSTDGTSLQHAA